MEFRHPVGNQRADVPAMYVRHEALFVRMEVEDLDLPGRRSGGVKLEAA
jgi:hypothetical protein